MRKLASLAVAGLCLGLNAMAASAAQLTMASDANFKSDVLSSSTPVVVDFYADWCGPCRRMGPVFDNLSSKYNGSAKFVRVNIDQSPRTAAAYGISSIPAFAVFKNGRIVDSSVGAVPEQQLSSMISRGISR